MHTPRPARLTGATLLSRIPFAAFPMVLLTLLACTVSLAAQEAATPSHVTVTGRIVDHAGGQPVSGAIVNLPALRIGAITDEAGRFTIGRVPPGTHSVQIRRLGYVRTTTLWTVTTDPRPIVETLQADPVVMEGVTVTTDRLARRRNAVGASVRVLDKGRLQNLASRDLLDATLTGAGLVRTSCGGGLNMMGDTCVYSRGRPIQPRVYIDELPSFIDVLASFQPWEIHTVEVIGGGRQIRVYTDHFMERVARNPRRLGALPAF